MNMLLIKYFRIINAKLYSILGSEVSSNLAMSPLGTWLFKLLLGKSHVLQVYEGMDGIKLKLTPEEANVLGFFHMGVINPLESGFLKKHLTKGETFIDVGAYVDGWYSLLAARVVGKTGKVYSFEPHPKYYARLVENIQLNNYSNVTSEKLGLSNKSGKRTFYEAESISSFYEKNSTQVTSQVVPLTINITSLDAYIAKHKIAKIDLVKIDVEGAEMEVLRGAIKLLSRKDAPDLIIEVIDQYLKNLKSYTYF